MHLLSKYSFPLSQIAPLLVALVVWLLMVLTAFYIRIDNNLYDTLVSLRSEPLSKEIVIVGIDSKSLEEIGSWPWPREYHAKLLDRLHSAKAVGLDLILSEPVVQTPETDEMLTESIQKNGKVVLPILPELVDQRLVEVTPLPQFIRVASGLGHVDTARDRDGVVRRTFLKAGIGAPRWHSFANAIYSTYLGKPLGTFFPSINLDDKQIWFRADEVLVPFPSSFQFIPYGEVLDGLHQDQIKNAIVLVGAVAPGLGDNHLTPNGENIPGIVIVASILNGMISDGFIHTIPDHWLLFLGVFILCFFDAIVVRFSVKNASGFKIYLLFAMLLICISMLVFTTQKFWLPFFSLSILLVLLGLTRLLLKHIYFRHQALTDGLTGLANRRHFDETFNLYIQQAKNSHRSLALLIIDIDFFKGYNDTYGHSAGDEVLKRIGATLRSVLKHSRDVAARIGGEEFAILLPYTSVTAALQQAEKTRDAVFSLAIEHAANSHKVVTCSIGIMVQEHMEAMTTLSELYESADIALYYSKQHGRNQVTLFDNDLPNALRKK